MASYHLSVKTVSRATGRSGPGAAAYRTATRIACERDGTVHDYTKRSGVEGEAFIVAPEGAAWAQDRAVLWNTVEAAEKRRDAKVAREYELALPCELDRDGRRALAREFAEAVVSRFGVAADVAIHMPGREGDQRNWHAHVLTTTRVVNAEGLGAKTRELDVAQTARPAVEALRELWAIQVNVALERIQAEARVDHRSYARQGVAREAERHLGVAASGMERQAARREFRQERAEPARADQEASGPVREASVAAGVAAPERRAEGARVAQDGPQEATRTVAAEDGRMRRAAQEGLGGPRRGQEGVAGVQPVESPAPGQEGPVRPSAGVHGAGREPVTRIGRENAAIQERNRAVEAARRALEVAQRVLGELERAAQRVRDLARAVGVQMAAERAARAQEAERQRQERVRAEAARRAEAEREAAARLAERERIAADLRQREQQGWSAEAYWKGLAEEGCKLRQADQKREGQKPEQERAPRQSRGPSMGR